MNEKNENENKKKKARMNGEKKFYLLTAIGSAVALVAIVVIAIVVSNAVNVDSPAANLHSSITSTQYGSDVDDNSAPDVNGSADNPNQDEPVGTLPEGMVVPVAAADVLNDYGFYHNKTLNCYYEHEGIDFTAEVGAEVRAVKDGVVESIFRDDILLGTEIVVDHGDGMKTLYRFVNASENLTVGASVKKGDIIATVAEANGNEYKDGAHLHFEISVSGENVDPALHLTLEEK